MAVIGQENTYIISSFLVRCFRCALNTYYCLKEIKSTIIFLDMGKIASEKFDLSGLGEQYLAITAQ